MNFKGDFSTADMDEMARWMTEKFAEEVENPGLKLSQTRIGFNKNCLKDQMRSDPIGSGSSRGENLNGKLSG